MSSSEFHYYFTGKWCPHIYNVLFLPCKSRPYRADLCAQHNFSIHIKDALMYISCQDKYYLCMWLKYHFFGKVTQAWVLLCSHELINCFTYISLFRSWLSFTRTDYVMFPQRAVFGMDTNECGTFFGEFWGKSITIFIKICKWHPNVITPFIRVRKIFSIRCI